MREITAAAASLVICAFLAGCASQEASLKDGTATAKTDESVQPEKKSDYPRVPATMLQQYSVFGNAN